MFQDKIPEPNPILGSKNVAMNITNKSLHCAIGISKRLYFNHYCLVKHQNFDITNISLLCSFMLSM
jgi:hypothetical protein